MSSALFECFEHRVPCQHLREYARGTSQSQEDELQLCVKHYKPRRQARPGDVTLLASHASGFPKEMYEPIWDELLRRGDEPNSTFRLRGVWIADVANQGYSGVLNEGKLGNEPSYFDHARDLLAMVNHFRRELPRPIVGFGHSMGGTIIANLALMHPRLLSSVVFVEPVINTSAATMNFRFAYPITFKRDSWPSAEAAEAFLRKNPLVKSFDPEVADLYAKHAFRRPAGSASNDAAVSLMTSPQQEVASFARAAYPPPGRPLAEFRPNRRAHPDLPAVEGPHRHFPNAFYRPEATITFSQLPHLRPTCLFVYGERSHMAAANAEGRAQKLRVTGSGVGGSGGAEAGMVADMVLKKASHFVCFERPRDVAAAAFDFFSADMKRLAALEAEEEASWRGVSNVERGRMDDDWRWWMHKLYDAEFAVRQKGGKAGGRAGGDKKQAKL